MTEQPPTAPVPRACGDKCSHSATIGKLAAALAKAQGQFRPAAKDKNNPFFGSPYADLASVYEAVREPLSKNGLSVMQVSLATDGQHVKLKTILAHESGEWIGSVLVMCPGHNETRRDPSGNKTSEFVPDFSPQAIGSCITYARRYALSAIVGVCSEEDDDGNAASNADLKAPAGKSATKPAASKPKVDLSRLQALITERNIPEEDQAKWLGFYKVARLDQLKQDQVDFIINRVTTAKE